MNQLHELCPALSVGAISANLMELGKDLATLEQAGAKLLHFDIMDGRFAPMLTVGPAFVKGCTTTMLKDVHMMIADPLSSLDAYAAAGADLITVHAESTIHVHRALQRIGELKNVNDSSRPVLRGLALNPGTPVQTVAPVLDEIDMVFLVAINPAFPGQKYIASTAAKARALKAMIAESGRSILLGIDGGVTKDNIGAIAKETRADLYVSGSAVFEGGNIAGNFAAMSAAIKR